METLSRENSNDFSSLDLTECENILKDIYNINKDLSLILLKFMGNDEKTFQYEVFHPITREKLNLSYCEKSKVNVFVPFSFSQNMEEIYEDLVNQGYDPLDLNDRFYREICTPYTSENGTDVLLDDREEFVYSSLVNASLCPDGCDYSEYSLNKKYIKCECNANNSNIVTLDLDNLNVDNAYKSFLSTMKSTNYKVMICYNLVFNFKIFCHNYGSIITLILFIAYVGFMIYYCFKEITPIKIKISKIIFEEQNKDMLKEINLSKFAGKKHKPKGKVKFKEDSKINYPPKKSGKVRKVKKDMTIYNNNLITENIDLIVESKSTKSTKHKQKRRAHQLPKPSEKELIHKDAKSEATRVIRKKKHENEKDMEKSLSKNKILDDFELNNLEYVEACEYDKRTCLKTYWSVLKREHTAILTFVSWDDYNLFYVKIERFLILFCTDMTMNGLFFIHESMHKKYTEGEDFTFVQKLPQLIFTLLVAHALEILLCFLGITDTHVYEIKSLPPEEKKKEKVMQILDKIKRKLISFFIVTLLLFLFYWYFISAFCAVYQNTQKIFLRDSLISFATSLIDPFIIYGITTILRKISLSIYCRKKCCCGCIYKLSDLIPIF